jgi:hypothetical protein
MDVKWVPKGSAYPAPVPQIDIDDAALARLDTILDFDDYRGRALRVTIACATCGNRLSVSPDDLIQDDIIFTNGRVILLADDAMRRHLNQRGGLILRYLDDPFKGQGLVLLTGDADPCRNPACQLK